jgi:hypothetical protein
VAEVFCDSAKIARNGAGIASEDSKAVTQIFALQNWCRNPGLLLGASRQLSLKSRQDVLFILDNPSQS